MATPSHIFTKLAPYLILAATASFSAQELLTQTVRSGATLGGELAPAKVSAGWRAAIALQFLVAIYGGDFGAGMGILNR
jgi:uncharacterized membrane protein YfcA